MITGTIKSYRNTVMAALLALAILLSALPAANARPVSEAQVRTAALNWVRDGSGTLSEAMGTQIKGLHRFQGGPSGEIGYYLVQFEPNGWALFPADDSYWPVPTFSKGNITPEHFKKTLWYAATRYDKPASSELRQNGALTEEQKNKKRWQGLLSESAARPSNLRGNLPSKHDMRVAPMLGNERLWGQADRFNEFTSFNQLTAETTLNRERAIPWIPDAPFPAGCTALSTAQLMSHILADRALYPASTAAGLRVVNMGPHEFGVIHTWNIFEPLKLYTAYFNTPLMRPSHNWKAVHRAFTTTPNGTPVYDAAAINRIVTHIAPLIRDIGVSSRLRFSIIGTGGVFSPQAIRNQGFNFAERIICQRGNSLSNQDRNNLILPNLDLKMPVGVSINFFPLNTSAHSCVVDGYAYAALTANQDINYDDPYYHLSTGSGESNAPNSWDTPSLEVWSLNLAQDIRPSRREEAQLHQEVLFNLFPNLREFIPLNGIPVTNPVVVSGRVFNRAMQDAGGAAVRITWEAPGGVRKSNRAAADAKGIYAFVVDGNSSVKIEVETNSGDYVPIECRVTQNTSNNRDTAGQTVSHLIGNRAGLDFIPMKPAGVKTQHEDPTEMFEHTFISGDVLSFAQLASPDYVLDTKVLVIGSDPDYDYEALKHSPKVLEKVCTWVNEGGTLVVSGKSDIFVQTLGQRYGIAFRSRARLPRVYGPRNSKVEHNMVKGIADRIGTDRTFSTTSPFVHSKQSVLRSFGSAKILSTATYILEVIRWDYWGPSWGLDTEFCATGIDFNVGDKGGRVIYFNQELALNHAEPNAGDSTGTPRKFINYILRSAVSQDHMGSRLSAENKSPELKRGLTGSVFYHQTGDRRSTLEDRKIQAIRFGRYIRSQDIRLVRVEGDLALSVSGTKDRITVPNWFTGNRNITEITFEDGSRLDARAIEALALPGEPEIDITPFTIRSRAIGSDGDDTLNGNQENQFFLGGKGDDTIQPGGGQNIIYYRQGDGNDTLVINKRSAGDSSILRFDTGIASTDVTAKRSGEDLLIHAAGGSIRVRDWYAAPSCRLDRVDIYGGVFWDARDLEKLAAWQPLTEREIYFEDKVPEPTAGKEERPEEPGENRPSSSGCAAAGWPLPLLLLAVAGSRLWSKRR